MDNSKNKNDIKNLSEVLDEGDDSKMFGQKKLKKY